jgi:hypothetical protein
VIVLTLDWLENFMIAARVGTKNTLILFTAVPQTGHGAPQPHSLVASLEFDDLILDDVSVSLAVVIDHPEHHVVLGPRDPPDAAMIQIEKVLEVHVGLVENDDFARSDIRADLPGALVVVLLGGIDDGETWQETVFSWISFGMTSRPALPRVMVI